MTLPSLSSLGNAAPIDISGPAEEWARAKYGRDWDEDPRERNERLREARIALGSKSQREDRSAAVASRRMQKTEEDILEYLRNGELRLTPMGPAKDEDVVLKEGQYVLYEASFVLRFAISVGNGRFRRNTTRNFTQSDIDALDAFFTQPPHNYERADSVIPAWYTNEVMYVPHTDTGVLQMLYFRKPTERGRPIMYAFEEPEKDDRKYFPEKWHSAYAEWIQWRMKQNRDDYPDDVVFFNSGLARV